MDIDTQFLKGSIGLLLLNLLSRGEMYGYEIRQEASRRSANAFEFKEGTLYPALHKLESAGHVESYEGAENNRPRRYYRITKSGRTILAKDRAEWQAISQAVTVILGEA